MFVETTDMLVMRCTVDTDGKLITPKGWHLDDTRFDALRPYDIIDRIADLRLHLLDGILSPFNVILSKLKTSVTSTYGCCFLYSMTMLGSLIISAAMLGLDPIPRSGSEFRGSVTELVEKLDALMVEFAHENKKNVNPLPTAKSLSQDVIKNKEETVPKIYLERLLIQSKKIGLLK